MIRKNDTVTWGSGKLRGHVLEVIESEALVALIGGSTGLCGRTFDAGSEGMFPLSELRRIELN